MQLNAIIVEDELRSREFLKKLISEFCPQVTVVKTAATVDEAIAAIDELKPQILFLDIELHTGNGFDVLAGVAYKDFSVIFTTAYDHYAIKAIKFSAIDYLLKPIDVSELQSAVEKVVTERKENNNQQALQMLMENVKRPSGTDFSITLATSEGLEFVPLQNIIRLEASGPYTHFFLKEGKKIIVCKNLKEYETLLTEHQFFRVHNSHIINIKEVKRMVKSDGGYAVMNDDSMINISPKKKDEFMLQMSQRLV